MWTELTKVLFVSTNGPARGLMAAAWLNSRYGMRYEAEGTGYKMAPLSGPVVDAMLEAGVDLRGGKIPSVVELMRAGRSYDYVITLCDPGEPAPYPVFPGAARRAYWRVHDPDRVWGDVSMWMDMIRHIRCSIIDHVDAWVFNAEPVVIRELA